MRKVKVDSLDELAEEFADGSCGTPVLCCSGMGAVCSVRCAAYSEYVNALQKDDVRREAKCNAFKFTIGEL